MTTAHPFSLRDQNGKTVTLESFKGKKLILYFYPKADTPGCTVQACGLRDNIGEIKAAGAVVVGISPDGVSALKKFEQKHGLPFTLLADPETTVAQAYGVWKEKQFMGRRYMGVERTTFLIDGKGDVIKVYERVNPITHADMIIADVHGTKTSPSGAVVVRDLHEQNKTRAAKVNKNVKKNITKAKAVKNVSTSIKVAKKPVKKPAKKTVRKPTKLAKRSFSSAKKTAAKKKK